MSQAPCRPHWRPVYIGIGSNLDAPEAQVRQAVERLAGIPGSRLIAVSPLYRSAPMGPEDQPDYINAAAAMLTTLTADELLDALQAIEVEHGRRRDGERWGPRTLDLDLLVYAGERRSDARLTLPHPGIAERNFVLFPLRDIAPHLVVPGLVSVKTLAEKLDADPSSITRLEG